MGRSKSTFRECLRSIEERWQPFRRGLRAHQKEHFDDLFERASSMASAASYQNPEYPYRAAFLSMLLVIAIELRELEERVGQLEEDADDDVQD